METIATKFVTWDVPALEMLEGSKVYNLRKKLNNGEKMNREEKNRLTEEVNSNVYFKDSKDSVLLQGWKFSFSDVVHTFIVRQYGHWREYKAVDKTGLRKYLCGRIEKIVKI